MRRNQRQSYHTTIMVQQSIRTHHSNHLKAKSHRVTKAATQEANDKPFKCTIPGCVKSYKNPNGLKYHTEHGHRSALSDTEVEKKPVIKPYRCNFPECEKRYKNPNGLKYHVEHAHHTIIRRV
ncbi:C2H2-type zinc finger transcription factor [Gigaspora margarita]|uniref:C2H2-type zinc finger transcription factor n=2 Tax=Gigaspora margarita TaxID=4874 RepID=A0A8H3XDF4_GIGMA|nr:C2H2-type zinc finger transcription factor [Gigaspora margarita]